MATDPWEEEAKQFKAAPQAQGTPTTTSAPNEDWKVWQQGNATSQSSQGNFLQQAVRENMQSRPYSTDQGILGNIGTAGRNLGAGALSAIAGGGGDWPVPLGSLTHPERPLPKPQEQRSAFLPQSGESFGDYLGRAGGEATKLVGNIGTTLALGKGAGEATEIPGKIRPQSSPSIVPPAETAAERLTQALRPAGGIKPSTVQSVQSEAPAIREYAQRTNNPLKTTAEGLKAAQGVANEGLTHYKENFLAPNKDVQVQLPSGTSELGHVSTIGGIDERLGKINDILRGTEGKSEGATMTAQERTGLEGEAKALRQKLYESLSEKTGVKPEDIKTMREGYGGQYTVANALQSGRMARLDRGAAESQGGTALNVPQTLGSLPDRLWKALRGGEEAIANRQFGKRIQAFEPQAPNLPMPQIQAPKPYESPIKLSPEMEQRVGAQGSPGGVRPGIFTDKIQNPLPNVNEVPELQKAAQSANALREQGNAEFAARKTAQTEAQRQAALRQQQLLAKAREGQRQAQAATEYRRGPQ